MMLCPADPSDTSAYAPVAPVVPAPRPVESLPPERNEARQAEMARIEETLDRAERLLSEAAEPEVALTVSVIMPVYNERATIETIVMRVLAVSMRVELIIVDDGSSDGTDEVLRELESRLPIKVLRHDRNRGKGAALRTGFAAATGEVIAVQDADLEYDPAELPMLVRPIALGCCDVIYGSRYLAPVAEDPSWWHRAGNQLLTGLSNFFTKQNLTDMETCYKVFRRSLLEDMNLVENGFGCEPELTAKLARRALRIYELPIRYAGRGYSQGKKIGVRDALATVASIVRHGLWKQ